MFDYAASADAADRLIRENGRLLSISRETAGEYDPISGTTTGTATTTWELASIVLPATFRSMIGLDNGLLESGALVLSKARKILAAAKGSTLEPVAEDIIVFDGLSWRVLACVPLNPAGISIIYKIGVVQA